MRNKYIDNFFKYVVNSIILIALCTLAFIFLQKEQKTLEALDKELIEDPISIIEMYNTSGQMLQLQKDIEDITNQILTTNVNIKMANRCRYGLCYDDVDYLENELANYKIALLKKEEELKKLQNHFKRL